MLGQGKRLAAVLLVMIGVCLLSFGSIWAPVALDVLPDTEFGFWLELVVPFLPMLFIALGAALFVSKSR